MQHDDIFAKWQKCVPALNQNHHEALLSQIAQLRNDGLYIYPPQHLIFNALTHCEPQNISVIILGQDPYHQPNQAQGLAFSVSEKIKTPPSLRNILKELHEDVHSNLHNSGQPSNDLTYLAKQGVLLLNTILTVEHSKPLSHENLGWQAITKSILQYLADLDNPLAILLWGKPAQAHASLFNSPHHLVLQAPHPSPLSAFRGFFGCKHFSKANNWLVKHKLNTINW